MGDSDDEYDRRRGRDKFRRERNDFNDRPVTARRDDWPERTEPSGNWSGGQRDRLPRRDYRDGYNLAMIPGGARINHSHFGGGDRRDLSPPMKRLRGRDIDDRYMNYELGGHHNRGGGAHYAGGEHRMSAVHDDETCQPPMMTLKQFLNEQDDNITEDTLICKFNEYKINFKRTQIREFFNRHKDEEWFRSKYFPEEMEKRKERLKAVHQNRLAAFMDLFEKGWIQNVTLDVDNNDQITRLLDAAIIKLEGGTDFDLKSLDENPEQGKTVSKDASLFAVEDRSTSKASLNEDDAAAVTDETTKEKGDMEAGELSHDQNVDGNDEVKGETRKSNEDGEPGENKTEQEDENKPRPLHKTCSIFFRNLIPSITRQELEEECKKFGGFLRLALSEPQMDRRFVRRGWATYERNVKIRDICWSLSSVKIKGTDIGAIVNRDLARRIRSVIGLTSHSAIVRADIRHAAKLIMKLDAEKGLWQEEKDQAGEKNGSFKNLSSNPLMKNITDYLIEEASAEEAALLGDPLDYALGADVLETVSAEAEKNGENGAAQGTAAALKRDDELIAVLDRLILYLRVVHSLDFYTLNEYPLEDEMPNRIGLLHARGLFSSTRVSPTEIADYIKEMESKVTPLLEATATVTPAEAARLGLKEIEEAVEDFIKENTKEVGEGKWLCPLSNKKFMGADFVRKHILNKHAERIELVKAETRYFNNYVLDARRPMLPENPLNRPAGLQQQSNASPGLHGRGGDGYGRDSGDFGRYGGAGFGMRGPFGGGGGRYHLTSFHPPGGPSLMGGVGYDGFPRGGGGGGFKRNRSYRDLDAPADD